MRIFDNREVVWTSKNISFVRLNGRTHELTAYYRTKGPTSIGVRMGYAKEIDVYEGSRLKGIIDSGILFADETDVFMSVLLNGVSKTNIVVLQINA